MNRHPSGAGRKKKSVSMRKKGAGACIACIAGRISFGVGYCFGIGATRKVGIQVNFSCLPQFLDNLNGPQPGLQEFLIG